MSRQFYAKYICDICGDTIAGDANPHMDPRFSGWVEFNLKRRYGSACHDAEVDYWDGHGDLCPKCMDRTGIKLREAKK